MNVTAALPADGKAHTGYRIAEDHRRNAASMIRYGRTGKAGREASAAWRQTSARHGAWSKRLLAPRCRRGGDAMHMHQCRQADDVVEAQQHGGADVVHCAEYMTLCSAVPGHRLAGWSGGCRRPAWIDGKDSRMRAGVQPAAVAACFMPPLQVGLAADQVDRGAEAPDGDDWASPLGYRWSARGKRPTYSPALSSRTRHGSSSSRLRHARRDATSR